jgi:hypothetical protein
MNDPKDQMVPYWWQSVAPSVASGGLLGSLVSENTHPRGLLSQFDPPDETWDRSIPSWVGSTMPFGRAGGIPGLPTQPVSEPWFTPRLEEFGPRSWDGGSNNDWLAMARKAVEPITSYPETYSQMNREAREQVARGIDQIRRAYEPGPRDPIGFVTGLGNVGLGALGYVTSPISAGLRTIAGKPLEETTGIPKEYTEFALSLGIPGLGLRPASSAWPAGLDSLGSRSTQLYNPPIKPPRPFTADYPQGAPADATGRLLADIEGRPLTAERVVGRRTLGGSDEALSSAELDALAEKILGRRHQVVPASALPKGTVGVYDPNTGHTLVYRGLPAETKDMVAAHELSHGINDKAGEFIGLRRPNMIPIKPGMPSELRAIYNDLNNSYLAKARGKNPDVDPSKVYWGTGVSPERFGYSKADAPSELMAEAVRAYLADPNYLKTVAPRTAAQIRAYVNAHPTLSKFVQFNTLAALMAGAADSESGLEPTR